MNGNRNADLLAGVALIAFGVVSCLAASPTSSQTVIKPGQLQRIGTVSKRFQSYSIEMVEVTGGRFWKPYASKKATESGGNQPAGMSSSLFEYRKPINLYNARLRTLAAALGPAYLRVSGTWANSTYFWNSNDPAPASAPAGFKAVLTREEWKGVVDFANATNAKIVTSFAISPGTRGANGVWTPEQAQQILDYTKSVGGSIAAAEFMNEPTMAEMGGAPKGYNAVAFGRDFNVFRAFAKKAAPDMLILGPGGVLEDTSIIPDTAHEIKSDAILSVTGPVFDVFSYHTYGAVSSRCAAMGGDANTSASAALTENWLSRGDRSEQFYAAIRDRFEPGKPMWVTETAQAACGGDIWASTFLDTFRYLNQLGDLARRGVQVQLHNTLAASDYGLLDEKTYEPRPNYWAALLWRRLMGTSVLDAGSSPEPNLYVYAQCLRNHPGGVSLLVINADDKEARSIHVASSSERYTLTAQTLTDKQVQLNGIDLKLGANNALPELNGVALHAGRVTFAPASITFLAVPDAHNAACQK